MTAAPWTIHVIEFARSKGQPWVDPVSGMARDGDVDLPFSFVLAERDDKRVLVDTGFMQDENSSGFLRPVRHPELDFTGAHAR